MCPQKNGVGVQWDKNAWKTGSLACMSTLECVAIGNSCCYHQWKTEEKRWSPGSGKEVDLVQPPKSSKVIGKQERLMSVILLLSQDQRGSEIERLCPSHRA